MLVLDVLILVAKSVDWMAVLISQRMMILSASNVRGWAAVAHIRATQRRIKLALVRRSSHGSLILRLYAKPGLLCLRGLIYLLKIIVVTAC